MRCLFACLCVPLVMLSTSAFAQNVCAVADPTGTPLNVRATRAGQLLPEAFYNGAEVIVYQTSRDGRGKAWLLVGKPGGNPYGWVFRDNIRCEESPAPNSAIPSLAGRISGAPKVLRTTSIPSPAVFDQKVLFKAMMNEFYGTFSQNNECWITKRADETDCMKPYKVDIVGSDNNRRLFIVIAGQRLNDDGTPQDYHAASGVLGLIVLSENGAQLGVVATNGLYEDFGSFGKVPPLNSFNVRELGPNASYGWVIRVDGFGAGEELDANSLYAVVGDTITSIGSIPAREIMENEVTGCGKRCSNYSIELLIDSTAQNAPFYPLILRASGIKDGRPFNKTYRVFFDPSSYKYLVPHEIE